jgi:hypothetical protein
MQMKKRLYLTIRCNLLKYLQNALTTLLFVVLSMVICPVGFPEEDNLCDDDIFRSSNFNDNWGYYPRGTRCEGRYIRKTGSHILVVSLTEYYEDYDIDSAKELIIEWTPPENERVWLRAYGIGPDLYYRMDTSSAPGSKYFRWPTDVINGLKISRKNLGVVGWMNLPVHGGLRRVYLPLRVWQKDKGQSTGSYEVIFQSDSRLAEVYYSLTKLKTEDRQAEVIVDGKELNYGNYPPRQGIKIDISDLKGPGIYYLEIMATQKNGVAADPIEMWFYHLND